MDPLNIPGCTYCHPQVASVGLTEAKAKEAGFDVKVGNFPFMGNGKAIALGEAEGFIKTVFDARTGELLGAHMVGAEVTELIQGYTIGKTAELVEADFMHTVFPHPLMARCCTCDFVRPPVSNCLAALCGGDCFGLCCHGRAFS
jgi:dihydrolipoamide dehydrogenase